MDYAINCGVGGWLAIAATIVTYGVTLLAGAALIKYVFFGDRATP